MTFSSYELMSYRSAPPRVAVDTVRQCVGRPREGEFLRDRSVVHVGWDNAREPPLSGHGAIVGP